MQPIKYEQHCRSCHPLQLPGRSVAVISHGLPAAQLEAAVMRSLAADGEEKSAAVLSPQRPIPGKMPRPTLAGDLDPPPQLRSAQRLQELRTNVCGKCHSWQPTRPAEVMPAAIPALWLAHAKFNHKAHRAAAKCEDCHAQAIEKLTSADRLGKLADDDRVMIPNIDNCIRCHAPRNERAGTGGARFDCAQCHRYHNPPAKPTTLPIFASHLSTLNSQLPDPKSFVSASHPFVGTQSCSATGCHGAPQGSAVATSYTKFVADDPHSRAFLLLYAQSSRDMVRRLTNGARGEREDEGYFKFLQQKCVGCHATPPAEGARVVRPESFAAGISCESCHGPAASWELTHFNRAANKSPDLRNLTDLSLRATTCAQCHIGPQLASGQSYDVNHDLIAAGHPRLTFDFEAQLANLPTHWSAAKNVQSHFDAWRLGELATAAQQDKLHASRATPELASHRCFDCHHSIQPIREALPRRENEGNAAVPRLRVGLVSPPRAQLSAPQRKLLSQPTTKMQAKQELLLKLLDAATSHDESASSGTRWEELVRFDLALAAFIADHPGRRELASQQAALEDFLAKSFRPSAPERKLGNNERLRGGPYDSPAGFHPNDPNLKTTLDAIRKSLASP
jgi:Cytochrome c7 and related cytochrome c/Cytochrome c554 and c-prime